MVSDSPALLAAVLDAPDDDLPRLVYADWLEDTGQPERAEFIRVQVAIARCRCRYMPCVCDAAPLRHREHALWLRTIQWFNPLVDLGFSLRLHAADEAPCVVVRRGFVAEVRLPLAAFLGERCDVMACAGSGRNTELNARCDNCSGTGRIPGVAADLFARHPIERVVLTDLEPRRVSDSLSSGWTWSRQRRLFNGELMAGTDTPHTLPDAIRELLPRDDCQQLHRDYLRWGAPEAALDALSVACVAYGRQLVKMSPLH